MEELRSFFALTPERVLAAADLYGRGTTGMCYALNSLENRVYEIELDDGARVVGKFYRPGRWSRETILDEHAVLRELERDEVPVVAPLVFPSGETLLTTNEGIFFALFPRRGGRAPDDLAPDDFEQLGRLIARIHSGAARVRPTHRPQLSPRTYGADALEVILSRGSLSPGVRARFEEAARRLVARITPLFVEIEATPIHADFHRGNVLRGAQGWVVLDFDDMAWGPSAQDFWLLLPARPRDAVRELEALIAGYEQFRAFDRRELHLIEPLRALRYLRYAAWITQRWDDPSFARAFPDWGKDRYWEQLLADLNEQVGIIDAGG